MKSVKRCESVAGWGKVTEDVMTGFPGNGIRYSEEFRMRSRAMTIDWPTSMPLIPAMMLMLLGAKMESAAI